MLGHVEHCRDLRAEQMWNLRRGPNSELPLAGLVLRDDAASLHRERNQSLVHQPLFDDLVGLLERSLQVTALEFPMIGDVVFVTVGENRRALFNRFLRVNCWRQWLVIRFNQVYRTARRVPSGRNRY